MSLPGPRSLRLDGTLKLHNLTEKQELFIPQLSAAVEVLSDGSLEGVRARATVTSRHELGDGYGYELAERRDAARPDGFWGVHIVKGGCFTVIDVAIEVDECDTQQLQAVWLQLRFQVYGPAGLQERRQDVVLPVACPNGKQEHEARWKPAPNCPGARTLSVPTHLLCHLDDPVSVVQDYVANVAAPGDVVCLAESALAVMQGRWRHYESVRIGWLARLGCRLFAPISSMASACGLQAAIDLVGAVRAAAALVLAVLARLLGVRGVFYRVVGRAAAALDDLTGTLPPYDHFIVLGPTRCAAIAAAVASRTGIAAAIVDVNNLSGSGGDLTILAASEGVDTGRLAEALRHNPGGNADEGTPLVLIRGLAAAGAAPP